MTPLTDTEVFIRASSRRQAMDWSLVLLSQGIETVVDQTTEGWGLLIPKRDQDRARETIRQYRQENRGWAWHRQLNWPPVSFDFGVLAWCAVLILFHGLAARPGSILERSGALDSLAVQNGAWWRLFTPVTLHADVAHLTANLALGFCFLGLAMGRFGPGVALLSAYLAGAGGNLFGVFAHAEPYRGLGASGMVMGALGMLATQSLSYRAIRPVPLRYAVTGMAAGVMLFVLLGLDPRSDVAAHFGGLLFGIVIGCALTLVPHQRLQRPGVNAFAGTLLVILVALIWMLALQ